MKFDEFMKIMYPAIDPDSKSGREIHRQWQERNPEALNTAGRTMTEEDLDLAVGHVVSFYQSKRAMLKKQVTHWMGKFAIVKHENNRLRHKYISSQKQIDVQIHNIRYMREEITKLKQHMTDITERKVADVVEKNYEVARAKIKEYSQEKVGC
jgi:hypothetical protein